MRGQFGHEGDDAAGIERDAENVCIGTWLAVEREALARRDRCNAGRTEIGPDNAGADETEMRSHNQAIDLFIGRICNRKSGPVAGCLAVLIGLHFDAADNAVRTGRCRHLHAFTLVAQKFDSAGEVEGGIFLGNLDWFDGRCLHDRNGQKNHQCQKPHTGKKPLVRKTRHERPTLPLIMRLSVIRLSLSIRAKSR